MGSVMDRMIASYYLHELELEDNTVGAFAEAADRFIFPHVIDACRRYMFSTLRISNASTYLKVSDRVPTFAYLRPKCISVITTGVRAWLGKHNAEGPYHSNSNALTIDSLRDILATKGLCIGELDKLEAIAAWCQSNGDTDEETDTDQKCMPECLFDTIELGALSRLDFQRLAMHPLIRSNADYIRRILDFVVSNPWPHEVKVNELEREIDDLREESERTDDEVGVTSSPATLYDCTLGIFDILLNNNTFFKQVQLCQKEVVLQQKLNELKALFGM
eukprot:jgi/Botrbrau1/21973/Bobra.0249s0095.1